MRSALRVSRENEKEKMSKGIYLDNAATSWPKPKAVCRGMKNYLRKCGGNPGRSGHKRAIEAARIVFEARDALSELFSIEDPAKIIFTKNATEAINMVLHGMLRRGDHVVTTSMEHNSVLRPINALREKGVDVTFVPGNDIGIIDPAAIENACKDTTKLIAFGHASNVTGTVQDLKRVSEICRKKNILFLVDAAQSAGVIPINCREIPIDFLAMSGHKGLLGPQGTGCLCLRDTVPPPLLQGGTGSLSDRDVQPDFLPDALESGTLNTVGIAGLLEGVRYIRNRGIDELYAYDRKLFELFVSGLSALPGVTVYGDIRAAEHTGVLSIRIEGVSPSEVGQILDTDFNIQTRIGLHCAPMAHRTIGTFPEGTVRFGWGPFTTEREIETTVTALGKIIKDF